MSDPLAEMGKMIANIGQGQEEEQPNQQVAEEGEEERTEPAIQMEEEEEEEMDIELKFAILAEKLDGKVEEHMNEISMKVLQAITGIEAKITTFDKINEEFEKKLKDLKSNNEQAILKLKELNVLTTKFTAPVAPTTQPSKTNIQGGQTFQQGPPIQSGAILAEQMRGAMGYNLEVVNQLQSVGTPAILQLQNSSNSNLLRQLNETSYLAVKQLGSFIGSITESMVVSVLGNAHLAYVPRFSAIMPNTRLPPTGSAPPTLTTTTISSGPSTSVMAGLIPSSSKSALSTPQTAKKKPTGPPNAPLRAKRGRPSVERSNEQSDEIILS